MATLFKIAICSLNQDITKKKNDDFFLFILVRTEKNPYNFKTNRYKYLYFFHVVVMLLYANSNNKKIVIL
jgi:hypothetical protein